MKFSSDRQYLQQLIAQGEHQQQDFKYKVMDAEKLARSVSAFANTDGGRLLIGVRDDGHISGIRSEEEIYMMHSAAYKYCEPQPSIHFDTLHAEGRNVVIATVPPSPQKPVFALTTDGKRRAYIRIHDENIPAIASASRHLAAGVVATRGTDALQQRRGPTTGRAPRTPCGDAQSDGKACATAPPQSDSSAGPLHPLRHCHLDLPRRTLPLLVEGLKKAPSSFAYLQKRLYFCGW